MKQFLPLILGLFFILLCLPVRAGHIVGGEMTYRCLGGGDYEFTLRLYRDDLCLNCADFFDDPASIAIYRCNGNGCNAESSSRPYAALNVQNPAIDTVVNPDYPCLIPPSVRVLEAVYRFRLSDYGISLPPGNVSYHVVYQRCCRNITINNLSTPSELGATWRVEINPLAQAECNNSPAFKDFPPTVVCEGQPLEYDHGAVDPDGDSLVYSFCAPLDGGGPVTMEPTVFTCEGAIPTPPCPPPYGPVVYNQGVFSAQQPMLGDPVVTIDQNTGLISGTPNIIGQFVVGVCVEEYRDGQLIGKVFRDFQFNVASCDPTVLAQVNSDALLGPQNYLINSCGDSTVRFLNQSVEERFIDFVEWEFDINGEDVVSEEWSPEITFPGIGQYTGRLILNRETDCGDTAEITVNIFPEIRAEFVFEFDSCDPGPVRFTDLSFSGSDTITDWNWDFGDGNSSTDQNPEHNYLRPNLQHVALAVTDINACRDTITDQVPYFPVPEQLLLGPGSYRLCEPAEVFFENISEPVDERYVTNWDFGDGGQDTSLNPVHIYTEPGIYPVALEVVSPTGCRIDTVFNTFVEVRPSPDAGFSFSPDDPTNIEPTVSFFDQSEGAFAWFWDFGTGTDQSRAQNPVFTFPDTGFYDVMQVVTHPSGCLDTLIQRVDVRPEVRYFLPNAFTPNGDGLNDTYFGKGVLPGISDFSMTIWNRWGQLVFETSDPNQGWNGRYRNTGQEAPNDSYLVVVRFTGPRGHAYSFKGSATVVR